MKRIAFGTLRFVVPILVRVHRLFPHSVHRVVRVRVVKPLFVRRVRGAVVTQLVARTQKVARAIQRAYVRVEPHVSKFAKRAVVLSVYDERLVL